jgi:hypothetical protein
MREKLIEMLKDYLNLLESDENDMRDQKDPQRIESCREVNNAIIWVRENVTDSA